MMNLITDSWVPITWASGKPGLVSLIELFAKSADIADLNAKPHERIALMRLLTCITQAALDGPADHGALDRCRDQIQPKAQQYLQRWKSAFDLFGDGPRFLQVPNLKPAKEDGDGNPATKLDLTLATGNNATVFDNAGGSARPLSDSSLALHLVTFQNFAQCGTIGVLQWAGAQTPGNGHSNHAPCIPASMLHCYLQGRTLLEAIHLNLIDREQAIDLNGPDSWGEPVWQRPVTSLKSAPEIRNATRTYLGRLVPLARSIRLSQGGEKILLGNGLDYPGYPEYREPAATIVQRKDQPALLSASLERSLWRQLPAIAVRRKAAKNALSGPVALSNLPDETSADLWLGALVMSKKSQAKIEDLVEARYRIPAGMFRDLGKQAFEKGVAFAEGWEMALSFGVKTYAGSLKLQPAPTDKARRHFWTAVEQAVPLLLALVDTPAAAADFPSTAWGKAVRDAALDAFQFACSRQNPRQIEAFAKGRQQLFYRNPQPKTSGQPESSASELKIAQV